MDSLEGDIGIPSFTKPPRRASTLPSTTSNRTTNSTPHVPLPTPTPRSASLREVEHTRDLTRRLSFPDARLQDETLEKLRRWIIGFVLVDFDIDTGPNLDNNYPHFSLPPSVQHQLAFSSLPEGDLPPSVTIDEQGYSYSWRIPYPEEAELEKLEREKGKGKERYLRLPKPREGEETDGGLYGYVWFSQEQNTTLRRNYSQRSLVLLTHHPHLPGLFSSVLEILGPLHFLHAKQSGAKGGMVESACLNIAAWPEPIPGTNLELPLLGTVLNVSLPLPYQAQYPTTPTQPPPPIASTSGSGTGTLSILTSTTIPILFLPATQPLTPLCLLLFSPQSLISPSLSTSTPGGTGGSAGIGFTKLLLIWELLVLEEPLLVYSNDPKSGSEVLTHFKNLIRPIPFKSDSKPYFHIHDPSFPLLCRPGSKPPPGLLLSSTNPLVLQNCSKTWPHLLRIDRTHSSTSTPSLPSSSAYASQQSTLSPLSANSSSSSSTSTTKTSPTTNGISPLIGRRKGIFEDSLSARGSPGRASSTNGSISSSRSSSLASTNRQSLQHNDVWSNEGGDNGGSRSSSPRPGVGGGIGGGLGLGFKGSSKSTTNGTGGVNGGSVVEKGTNGDGWGLKSERKRHVKKDEDVWKLVQQKWVQRDYIGCDEVIYRHFASLTEKLLSPLSRYLLTASSTPSSSEFRQSLKTHGTPLSLRSTNNFSVSFSQPGTNATERFYARFWDTRGCREWRGLREKEREKVLRG
ncbi:hypothetical protein JCM16303_000237 [Sporobolomyces ruberrimus]